MFLVDNIVLNAINYNITDLLGIQIDTNTCNINYQDTNLYAHIVINDSCSYINGKKYITFNKGDIIISVNGNSFNENKMLWLNVLNMYVPLNTYFLIKSNMDQLVIPIEIAKQYNDTLKYRICNVSPIPYNNMYLIRMSSKMYYRWNDLVFIELSEELRIFYERLGIHLTNFPKDTDYAIEKHVILFNYNRDINNRVSKEYYLSMPHFDSNNYYFYTVNFIGKKKINNLYDLITILEKQKNITIKLSNNTGDITLLKAST